MKASSPPRSIPRDATAQSDMTASAQRTGASIASASSASDQALSNARTVEDAAGRLSGAIRAIAGQVEHSTANKLKAPSPRSTQLPGRSPKQSNSKAPRPRKSPAASEANETGQRATKSRDRHPRTADSRATPAAKCRGGPRLGARLIRSAIVGSGGGTSATSPPVASGSHPDCGFSMATRLQARYFKGDEEDLCRNFQRKHSKWPRQSAHFQLKNA